MFPFKRKPLVIYFGLCFPLTIHAAEPASSEPTTDRLENVTTYGRQSTMALETEKALTPGGVTLVDSAELNLRNVANLADMLRYVPGVWTTGGSTGDSTFFSSRGSNLDATNYDGNGIKLLQDGLPVTAADGNNHNRTVDPLSTRYATVARGANALTYGASTLGGAIDFISPTARDIKPEIFFNGGSNGQRQARVTAGAVAGNFDGMITLETRRWNGYREHHQQEREGLYANAGWQFSNAGHTQFYVTYIDNDQQLPGALTMEQFNEDPYQARPASVVGNFSYNVKTWRVANKTEWDLNGNSSLSVGFSYENQTLYHPIVYSPFFSLLINTEQRNAGTAVRYNLRLGAHDVLAGINYGQTDVVGGNYSHEAGHRKDLTTVLDNSADGLEVFLVDRWQIAPRWKLVYGVQAVSTGREVRNTDVGSDTLYNPAADYDSVNPRLGVIYQLADNSELFANLSRLYEAPTNYELEDDANPDNEALNAMHGKVIEAGTRGDKAFGKANQWHWELALYYGHLQDEILSVDDPNAPGTSLSANVNDTIHAGIESLIGASFALDGNGQHWIEPLLSLTVNKFSFDGDAAYGDNALPAAPGYAIRGEVLYRNANGFFAGPTFDIVDERYADFSNTYTIGSHALLGLRAGFARESWEVYAEARNLTDKQYVSVHGVRNMAAPDDTILQAGEPRSVYVGARLRF